MRLAAACIFALGWLPLFLYRSEIVREKLAVASRAERRWIPLTIVAVTMHALLVELALTTPFFRRQHPACLVLGVAAFCAGVAWWAWARRHLGPLDQPLDPARAPDELIVSGPFAVVRHPLALGMLVVALGLAVAAATPLTWTTFAIVALCLAQRCRQDEIALDGVFGAVYRRYAARTARLVPYLW